ncbi:alpha subunit of pyruvate dehydrogenase [Orbilia oligospora]|nr:alpha subunit of pyruvate dehydrogenase [Orbilia oligospora]KAF3211752.1 alpha subunit of pyruvate dehydrogenase [Orbilia oligospora]KAF3220993.1 alpha subunit of pyruvate dehydrogenase [Orbilia oligospora]KAF3225483.1 alpha subunit of pyruvate dehydrogenase [Orbilia oligospora]KAF3234403.1 alpha subunit of pyruvate dehydrogenase [Orbilia oligospora]
MPRSLTNWLGRRIFRAFGGRNTNNLTGAQQIKSHVSAPPPIESNYVNTTSSSNSVTPRRQRRHHQPPSLFHRIVGLLPPNLLSFFRLRRSLLPPDIDITMLASQSRKAALNAFRSSSRKPLAAALSVRSISVDATASQDAQAPEDPDKPFTVKLLSQSFDAFNIEPPSLDFVTTKNELIDMYKNMAAVRRMEFAADRLYKERKIRGFCHLSVGQEAVAVGMEKAITPDDQVITSYRCHGFAYMRGASVKSIIAELLGRREGIAYGKGGSMHMFAKSFYGGNGIVGAQVPVGAGIGFAMKYLGRPNVTFALYGDGAANQGQVFEAFNMAKLWDIPVVFGCENNKYGMGTSAARSSALTEYHQRGQYIPGLKVNGMDVLAVKQACAWAKEYTTSGKGPLVMEFLTYRYGGHSMSDPGTSYRTREEVSWMRTNQDAIAGLRTRLLDWGVVTEDGLKELDKGVKDVVDPEVAAAEAAEVPENSRKVLFEDIYTRGSEPDWLRGRTAEETYYYKE